MSFGFVKLFRKVRQQSWYQDTATPKIFMEILLTANFTEGDWEGVPVYPGEVITSVRKLAQNTGVTVQQARTGLKKLERSNVVKVASEGNYTRIKLPKWQDYQARNQHTTNTEAPKHLTQELTHPEANGNGHKTGNTANGKSEANTEANKKLTHKRNAANNNIRREEEEDKNFFYASGKKSFLHLATVTKYQTAWGKYLQFRDSRGKPFQSAMEEEQAFQDLQEAANHNPDQALTCVNQAIAGGYLSFIGPKNGSAAPAENPANQWEYLTQYRKEANLKAALDRGHSIQKLFKEVKINKSVIKPDGRIVNG